MHEFDLIREYFTKPVHHTDLGVGDDAALVKVSAGMQLAVSTDMLIAGRHFFEDTDPYLLGWKAMAVNVSDMVAMGALPKWATLSIALPTVDTVWLSQFSSGFFACAKSFNIDLIGGDTTRGPLTINVQIMGEVENGKALKRSGAELGDTIWVSGKLGKAALALAHLQGKHSLPNAVLDAHLLALYKPQPRVILGLSLLDVATSAIDISDGLLSEIGHMLKASSVQQTTKLGAEILLDHIPTSDYIKVQLRRATFQEYVLAGGDDYQLCFTAPVSQTSAIHDLSKTLAIPLTQIGRITDSGKAIVLDQNNLAVNIERTGFNHFND
jgi:thiamine-monophosphate kinase